MSKILKNLPLYLLFFFGIIGQLLIISPSGNKTNGNLLFWSAHAHDSMWHIAVSNEIAKGFPLQNPVFAGEKLVNYHIFSDILPSILHSVLKIPNLTIYFWIMPIIYSFLIGLLAYLVGKEIGRSKLTGVFSVFSVYFVGSFGFIVTLLKGKGIGGESLFWATQVQSSIGNPPQILSNILLLGFIYYLILYLSKKRTNKLTLIVLLIATSTSKVYAGMVLLPAIGLLSIYWFIKTKKLDLIFATFLSVVATVLIYLPFSKNAGAYLIYEPLWYVRRIFSDQGRIGIINFDLITQYYQSLHGLKAKIGYARYDIFGLFLILIGNLGIRSFGFFAVPKQMRKNPDLSVFLLSVALFSYIIPNLFLQKGVATNTSQTLQYLLLIFGIYFALSVSSVYKKIEGAFHKSIFILLLILVSIPTQIGLIHEFYSRQAFAKISASEIEALNYLKNIITNKDIILTPPYNQHIDTKEVPPPIWDWFDTSYVAAITEGRTYFSDYEQVDIMGYNYNPRKEKQELIFNDYSTNNVTEAINEIKVNFIYIPKKQSPNANFSTITKLNKIFDNGEVEIWRII